MSAVKSVYARYIGWTVAAFFVASGASLWMIWLGEAGGNRLFTNGEIMTRLLLVPALFATLVLGIMSTLFSTRAIAAPTAPSPAMPSEAAPFMAQVVGLQWLNPLQRMDYPTEWQLLWTLGLAKHNQDDDMVREDPQEYSKVQAIASVAVGNNGKETFDGYHYKYIRKLVSLYRDIYFSDSSYFYNAHSRKDKSTWRELGGIHVEYALPDGKFDLVEVTKTSQETIAKTFNIGNPNFPNSWTRSTPPDVRITMGGPNAGFTSLTAGLDYLQAHPSETVWVMNWDAPSRPKDRQINENMVQLILAGPDYKTGRAPLAWLSYPATSKVAEFESKPDMPSRTVQAWKAALAKAVLNAGKQKTDIGFAIHDAGNASPVSSDRIAGLAQTVTEELPELDFMKQTFNTPALLGEMGAGTALTNVALGIAYANHFGKTVLVAGTTDATQHVATLVVPPKVVRPIVPGKPWFRARGGNHVYLPWWGLRHDDKVDIPGFSR
jgi:hypothetical protein